MKIASYGERIPFPKGDLYQAILQGYVPTKLQGSINNPWSSEEQPYHIEIYQTFASADLQRANPINHWVILSNFRLPTTVVSGLRSVLSASTVSGQALIWDWLPGVQPEKMSSGY